MTDDDDMTVCERLGHRGEDIVWEDDDYIQWRCTVCGAEWEEDKTAP